MTEIEKRLIEKQAGIVAQARAALDSITDDTPEARANELTQQFDAAMAEYDAVQARVEREQRLIKAHEAMHEDRVSAPNVPATSKPEDRDAQKAAYEQVFRRYLRHGVEALNPEERHVLARHRDNSEQRAQSTSTTAGGYLIAEGFSGELVKSMLAWGPMLNPGFCRVISTATGNEIPWPTLNDTANKGRRLSENTQVTETALTFGQKLLNAYKYSSDLVLVSEELAQDSDFPIDSLVSDALAERLARIINEELTTADGSSKPNGIMNATSTGKTTAVNSAITFDENIDLEHSVDPAYRNTATCKYTFNDSTFKSIRKLKDGQGLYLWNPASPVAGTAATLNNYQYVINQDIASIGSSAKVAAFGDFSKYVVRISRELTMRRLVERYADYLQIGFVAFMRADGELMDTGAVKRLVMAA